MRWRFLILFWQAIFSRVARVCKNDISEDRSNRWTTFLKARLNCSIPGDFPFYFNEIRNFPFIFSSSFSPREVETLRDLSFIPRVHLNRCVCFSAAEATTDFVEGIYASRREKLIYAAFTTPPNSLSASAVCAFSLQDILNAFEGPFKKQDGGSSWMPDKGVCFKFFSQLIHIKLRNS